MKNFLVISLATLILAATLKDMTMFVFFKINQTDIIRKACINKEKPMVMCHGKCFLKKKIVEATETENNQPLAQELSKHSQLTLFLAPIPTIQLVTTTPKKTTSFFTNLLHSQSFISTLFEPPRLAA